MQINKTSIEARTFRDINGPMVFVYSVVRFRLSGFGRPTPSQPNYVIKAYKKRGNFFICDQKK